MKHSFTFFLCAPFRAVCPVSITSITKSCGFFPLGILSNRLRVCWVRKRDVLNTGHLTKPTAPMTNSDSAKTPLLCSSNVQPLLLSSPAGGGRAGLTGRHCRRDQACPVSPRPGHGRTATTYLHLLRLAFFYLDFIALVSFALPLLLCQNTWELFGTLCPSSPAFSINEMTPTCFTNTV